MHSLHRATEVHTAYTDNDVDILSDIAMMLEEKWHVKYICFIMLQICWHYAAIVGFLLILRPIATSGPDFSPVPRDYNLIPAHAYGESRRYRNVSAMNTSP